MEPERAISRIKVLLSELGGVRLGARLEPSAVDRFEAGHGVTLPSGFREFVLHVGNGGDGPGYGLEPLNVDARHVGLDEPFPLTAVWSWDAAPHPDPSVNERQIDACHRGWVRLGTEGCGLDWALIVSGAERGNVWNIEGQGAQPCAPSRDFASWYLAWLEWKARGGEASGRAWRDVVWADYAEDREPAG